MKKHIIILFTLACALISQSAKAGSPQYTAAMKTAVSALDSAKTMDDYLQAANTFERIAGAEGKEWLPDYYAAYSYCMVAFAGKDKKKTDSYLDQAEVLINKADSMQPNNSEITTVKGLLNYGRIMVDPMSRGKKYGIKGNEFCETAKQQDPNNPRPYLLMGQALLYTPKMFGGGKDKARPELQTAVDKYKTFKPADALSPHWGERMANALLQQCQ